MSYEIIESERAGGGYDMKFKVLADGVVHYLYYAEIPSGGYILGWHVYEISEENYKLGEKKHEIRYIGSFPGTNMFRANEAVFRALTEGLYIESDDWDHESGAISLVQELKKKTKTKAKAKVPTLKWAALEEGEFNEYYRARDSYRRARLSDGSSRCLLRHCYFVETSGKDGFQMMERFYEISEEDYKKRKIETDIKTGIPKSYIRFLGTMPHRRVLEDETEKKAFLRLLTEGLSIYPYLKRAKKSEPGEYDIRAEQAPLREPLEILESNKIDRPGKKYNFLYWKVLADGAVHYLLGSYLRKNKGQKVHFYELTEEDYVGTVDLNEEGDGPTKFVRDLGIVVPDLYSEKFCNDFRRALEEGN